MSTPVPEGVLDRQLWLRQRAKVKKRVSVWPSAYASGQVVQEYERAGGRYRNPGGRPTPEGVLCLEVPLENPMTGLDKWFAEKWVDLSRSIYLSGPKAGQLKPSGWVQCGRPDTSKGGYPKCRPLAEAKKMTPKQRLYAIRKKRAAERSAPKKKGRAPIMVKTYKKKPKDNPERRKLYIYPNEASKKVAKRALERRKKLPKSKRGGLDAMQAHEQGIGSGVMRARDIAAGKRVNAYQVKAFFDRHRGNYVKARADGKKWEDSKALQAWDLWGGEPMRKQVEAAVRKDKKARKKNPGSKSDTMGVSMKDNPKLTDKPYTVYLVQEKPRGMVLFAFKSDSLICPSASASEYAWRLNQSSLENSSTHIFTSEARLRKFLKKHKGTKISRGVVRHSNPRNSKVKDALAAEAVRYRDFNEFSEMYWNACSRGLYWIATNERRFHIGLPERKKIKDGKFFIACSPDLALQGKNEDKKYVAELDVTRIPKGSILVKRGTAGAEIKVTDHPGSIKVTRVLEADKARKSFKWQLSILPSSKEELRLIWEKAWKKRNLEDAKKKERRERMLEREARRAEQRAKEEAKATLKAERKLKKKLESSRKKKKERAERSKSTRASASKAAAAKRVTKKARSRAKSSVKEEVARRKKSPGSSAKKKASKKRGKWQRVKDNPSKSARLVPVNVNKPGR